MICFMHSQSPIFQSTPSVWRETWFFRFPYGDQPFQSTPSVWRETACNFAVALGSRDFNPLPPYGGRLCTTSHGRHFVPFQSTPSVWRETFSSAPCAPPQAFQSTPSVWRETFTRFSGSVDTSISIHSLRMEGDEASSVFREWKSGISIHSLRMEGDASLAIIA